MHLKSAEVGVAQPEQARAEQQQRHEDERARLRQVAAERGDHVDDELARGLAVPVEGRLAAQPRARRQRLQVVGAAAQHDAAARAERDDVFRQAVLWDRGVGVGDRAAALADGVNVEETGEHQREDKGEPPVVAQQHHERRRRDGEERAEDVKDVAEPVELENVVDAGAMLRRLARLSQPSLADHGQAASEHALRLLAILAPRHADINRHRLLCTIILLLVITASPVPQTLEVVHRRGVADDVATDLCAVGPRLDGRHGRHAQRRREAAAASGVGGRLEGVGGLLVVQTRREDEGVEPRRAAGDGGAARDGVEVGEGEQAARGEGEVRDRVGGPGRDERRGGEQAPGRLPLHFLDVG